MAKAKKASEPKAFKQLPLDLPADFVLKLDAFCEASLGAPRAKVIRQAVTEFIDHELGENVRTKRRYDDAIDRLQKERFTIVQPTPIGPKAKKDD